jgi:O-antigen biosynthesis protein
VVNGSAGVSVVLAGWYGATNLGDELLLSMFIEWVRERNGIPTVISLHPAHTSAAYRTPAVGYVDLPAIVEAVSGARLVVLGGGGLFQDYEPVPVASLERFPALNVAQFAQFAFLAGEIGVPVAALAQGVGPLTSDDARRIAAEVFQRVDVVSVRDPASASLINALGVHRKIPVAPDPGWAYRGAVPMQEGLSARFPELAGRKVFAMVLRAWPFRAGWEDTFIAAFAASMPNDWACLWLDFTRLPNVEGTAPRNNEIAARLSSRLPGVHVIWNGMALDEAAALIASCDAVIAMRLHGVLLGHLAGLPVIALEYDDKVRAMGDELGVPAEQRMALDRLAQQLPLALRIVAERTPAAPFRLGATRRARQADAALAHRELLHRAMMGERDSARAMPAPEWLPRWLVTQDERARTRIAAALARRNRPA